MFVSIFNCTTPDSLLTSPTKLRNLQNLTSAITNNTTKNVIATTSSLIKVNVYAKSIQCWTGAYYIHAIFSIILSVSFIVVCLIIQMTYFETKSSTHNPSAKSNSKSDVLMLISKIIILLIFGLFEQTNNQWVLIAVIFFLSAFMFFTYYEEMPYHNEKMIKVKYFFFYKIKKIRFI